MKKKLANYLLKCPICSKKMWFVGANDHRKSVHAEVSGNDFEKLIIEAIKSGKIKPRLFETANRDFISATQRITKERKYNKQGIRSIVSGGKTK